MRLFLALPLSPQAVEALVRVQADLRVQSPGANCTRPENLHLTLAFLGETPRVREAVAAMEEVALPPFSFELGGQGRFGTLYWAGVRPSAGLQALQGALADRLRAHGFSLESRPFRPHLTLAREVEGPVSFTVPRLEVPAWRFALMKSERRQGRLLYTPIHWKNLEFV